MVTKTTNERKRSRGETNQTNSINRVTFQENEVSNNASIAENLSSRAAKFARADPKSERSTTPTGSINERRKSGDTVNNASNEEQWPGPFSTAHQMIEQREAAKKAREEAIAKALATNKDANAVLVPLDEYDRIVQTCKWKPNTVAARNYLPSLAEICIERLLTDFNDVDEEVLQLFSTEICGMFAESLSRQRRFTPEIALKLAVFAAEVVYFPDCSLLADEDYTNTFNKVFGENKENIELNNEFPLRVLRLHYCGHGFTDHISSFLQEKCEKGLKLNVLEITGCYRLTETSLCNLLKKCGETLTVLDVSCNSRVGGDALSAIANMPQLTSLNLDYCTSLTDENFEALLSVEKKTQQLRSLSLAGLTSLSDKTFMAIIDRFGHSLTSLCIKGCVQLSDVSIVHIRECCRCLDHLDLSELENISTAALLALFITNTHSNTINNEVTGINEYEQNNDEENLPSSETVTPPGFQFNDSYNSSKNNNFDDSRIGQLSSVLLQGIISTTDDVIIELCRFVGKGTLRHLNMGGCSSLTSRSIAAVALHCVDSIEILDVSFVRGIKEETLGYLIDKSSQLKTVSVWGCTQLTDRFFNGLRNDNVKIEGRMV